MLKHSLVFTVCVAIFLLHVGLGWLTCEWSWVQRSGTLIVAVGVLMESWKVLTTPRTDNMPFWLTPEGHSAIRAAVIIVCVGTIIQGYADLLFPLFSRCGENP